MYSFDWYTENTLRLKFVGDATKADLQNSNRELLKYFDSVNHPITVIIDGVDAGKMPTDISGTNNLTKAIVGHVNAERFIFVGFERNPILKFVIGMVAKLNKKKFDIYKTLGEVERVV